MKKIELRNGGFTEVSDEDYNKVKLWKWYQQKDKDGYISVRGTIIQNNQRVKVRLHRWLLNAPYGSHVDHIDHNSLNNCRDNLRLCTPGQNQMNTRKLKKGTSQYKGVIWDKKYHIWKSYIGYHHNRYKLGQFNNEIEAAQTRDCAAILLHKQYAILNFPEKEYTQNELNYVQEIIDKIDLKEKSSKFKGVSKRNRVFTAQISYKDKKLNLGSFGVEIEAAKIYDKALLYLYPDKKHLTNFPFDIYTKEDIKKIQIKIESIYSREYGSKYRGVTKYQDKYRACIEFDNKKVSLGFFENEIDAAKAFDSAIKIFELDRIPNFDKIDSNILNKVKAYIKGKRIKRKGFSSKYFGVSLKKSNNKWWAYLTLEGKKFSVGYFSTEKEAALAYNKKATELLGDKARLNIIE